MMDGELNPDFQVENLAEETLFVTRLFFNRVGGSFLWCASGLPGRLELCPFDEVTATLLELFDVGRVVHIRNSDCFLGELLLADRRGNQSEQKRGS